MATLIFQRAAVERLIGKKCSDTVLAEALTSLGISFEGSDAKTITIETLANRPDYLSAAGVCRAVAAILGVRPGLRSYEARKPQYKVVVDKSVSKVRPFTACAVVKGITFDDMRIKEIIQMQEKLHQTYCRNRRKAAIGIYPMEKISWPIRFEARKPADIKFVPLESSREMTGLQILSTHATGREYGHLLEGLDKYPIFIDAANHVLSMPPIINSELTGKVTHETKEVFIECSGFDQGALDKLLAIIVCSLADEGGTIHAVEVEYASKHITPDLSCQTVPVSIDAVNSRLGLALKEADVKKALAKAGIGYMPKKAIVPPYRVDILHEVDIIEEIMIGVGMEEITALPSPISTVGMEDERQQLRAKVAQMLVGLGLLEVSTYHLDSLENQTTRCNVKKQVIPLLNKTNKEYAVLRAWMLPSLLGVLRLNMHHDYPQKIFLLGTVFGKDSGSDTGIGERSILGIALCHGRVDYTEARQVVEYVMRLLGLDGKLADVEDGWAVPGRLATLSVGKTVIATLGEVHPAVLQNWGLDMPTAIVEIDMGALFSALRSR